MSHGIRFVQGVNVFPLLPPKDSGAAGSTETAYIDCYDANWVSFLVMCGNLTSDPTDTINFVVSVSTDGSTTNVSIPFSFRLSDAMTAVGANGWGAITAATSDGTTDVINANAMDNMALWIDVDPAVVGKAVDGARWVRLEYTWIGPLFFNSAIAFVEHKYAGNTMSSS